MTAHIEAKKEDIAKNVIMPGDPLRAKYIAENFLEDVKLVNSVRNMLAYTGTYKNTKITIFGSGMGMPSMGIYSYELFKFYDVENIIRVGSAGSYVKHLDIYDLVLTKAAYSESSFAKTQNGDKSNFNYPSTELNLRITYTAQRLGLKLNYENIHSSDVFYRDTKENYIEDLKKYECSCVEMESFALFHNAKVLNKNAACILTISDSFISKKELSAEKRQTSFNDMIKLALESFLPLQ